MIPTRKECLELLKKYNVEEKKIVHTLLVEKVAVFIAKKLIEKGVKVDIVKLSRAALLHDIVRGKFHAQEGYEICLKEGIEKDICLIFKNHMLESILDGFETWEEKLLFYADKICKYEIIGIDERFKLWFESWIEKAKQIHQLEEMKQKTKELEKEIFEKAGIKFEDILKMTVKITYFVHGTTTDNEQGKSTGQNQGELSKLGIQQSIELKEQIKDKFDIVFCSDLKRAVDSAKLTFKDSILIVEDKRLRECNYGDLNGADEEKVVYTDHIDEPFPNGESLKDVEKRIRSFLKDLLKNYDNSHVAIVAHKASQLAIEVVLNGKTWEQAIKEDWRNTKSWQPGWEYEVEEKL